FVRSFQTLRPRDAVLAGVAAAFAMLGKYWSIYLLVGLGIAALSDPRRGAYFRSAAPWITAVAGLIVLAPHLVWLVDNDFGPLRYGRAVHDGETLLQALNGAAFYFFGSLGYAALPVLLALLAARPARDALAHTLWPTSG